MALEDIMTGLGNALRNIVGLRVYDFPSDRVETPASVLSLPETPYDVTLGGRNDEWTFPLWVLVAKADDKSAYKEMLGYLDAEGPKSIRAMIELDRTLGGTCDTAAVIRARPLFATIAGTEYLAVEFTLEVFGGPTGIPPSEQPSGDRVFYVNGIERMRLTEIGLGIGTDDPKYPLDIKGTARVRRAGYASSVIDVEVDDGYGGCDLSFGVMRSNGTRQTLYGFGMEIYDADDLSTRHWWVYDSVGGRYVLEVDKDLVSINGFVIRNDRSTVLPSFTTVQRDAIIAPLEGTTIYNTTTNKLNFYNGSAWEQVTSA